VNQYSGHFLMLIK